MKHEQEKYTQKIEPTKSELEILQVLWKYGSATVRQVNDKLNQQRDINYTSTLKLMQIMTEKGILKRDESRMKHIYHIMEEEKETKSHLLEKFLENLYQGSSTKLVIQLLGNNKTSKEDLKAIKEILDKLDKE